MENMDSQHQMSPEPSSHKTVTVVVHGRVQGVFFRDSCRRRAHQLNVRGWVRNRPDKAVEALFSGRVEDVDAMITWTHTGPPHAQVSQVQVTDAEEPDVTGFEVC